MGHVAVGSGSNTGEGCSSSVAVFDASGASAGSTVTPSGGVESCTAGAGPTFDPQDKLLYDWSVMAGQLMGRDYAGYVGESVNQSFNWLHDPAFAQPVSIQFLGADAAGNFFVQANVQTTAVGAGIDFGLGMVTGTVLLHYDPSGTPLG